MTNTGKPYEALTEQVFKRLLEQDRVCANVHRDVVLNGKSTAHQIDVCFDFTAGGTSYLTIIQCKDWASSVKQEQVLTFQAVLSDLPGQPRGIMVSRSGFQEGARNVAKHHGIELYELREPNDSDWEGLIQKVEITIKISIPQFRNTRFNVDEAWVREQMVRLNLQRLEMNLQVLSDIDEAVLETGEPFNMKTMLNGYIPGEPCDWTPIHHDFPSAVMVTVRDCPLPKLRVLSVDSEVRVGLHEELLVVELDHMIAYCFRDVLSGSSRFLDQHGRPMGSP